MRGSIRTKDTMAALNVRNMENQSIGTFDLNEQITEAEYHPYVIRDVVVQYLAHLRQGTHSTKTRGDVSGSTAKPYRQKGTGRARAGSVKSPIWRHGGIVFGPKPRTHEISINKKVRVKALCSALAEKIRQEAVIVVEDLEVKSHKTKEFKAILEGLGCSQTLVVVGELSDNLKLAARNLPNVEIVNYRNLNVYRLMKYKKVLFTKEALTAVEERLLS